MKSIISRDWLKIDGAENEDAYIIIFLVLAVKSTAALSPERWGWMYSTMTFLDNRKL